MGTEPDMDCCCKDPSSSAQHQHMDSEVSGTRPLLLGRQTLGAGIEATSSTHTIRGCLLIETPTSLVGDAGCGRCILCQDGKISPACKT